MDADDSSNDRRGWVPPPSEEYQREHPDWARPKKEGPEPPRILAAAQFMAGFVAPEYIVDGIIVRGRLYALTSPTGHGKTAVATYIGCHVATGRNIGFIEVEQADVIFLAGENPDDFNCRLHAACQAYNIKPDNLRINVLPVNFPLTLEAAENLKEDINKLKLNVGLVIVDTAAAYFPGDNDNDNVQMGAYARNLRVLTTCDGKPAVLTPAHPIKNPDKDNLLPRGGGAFLNEIDGNLTLWGEPQGEIARLHWQGKIRGPDFQPVHLAMKQVEIQALTDRKGRPIMSIVATLQTDAEAEVAAVRTRTDENTVLEWLRRHPGISVADIATNAGWISSNKGQPLKSKVHRLLKTLKQDKLATVSRGQWKLTEAGKKEVDLA